LGVWVFWVFDVGVGGAAFKLDPIIMESGTDLHAGCAVYLHNKNNLRISAFYLFKIKLCPVQQGHVLVLLFL